MINIRSMRKLQDNDGMTLKNGQKVCYKTGWQVATQGIETKDIHEAMRVIKQVYKGNCGIWYSEGIYYIDCSHRVKTKNRSNENRKAMRTTNCFKMGNYGNNRS